jgi:ATP-dependent Lon protease
LAALRAGIKTVLIPKENEKDLEDVPDNVKAGLTIIPVSTADEVLLHALTRPIVAIDWNEEDAAAALAKRLPDTGDASGATAH